MDSSVGRWLVHLCLVSILMVWGKTDICCHFYIRIASPKLRYCLDFPSCFHYLFPVIAVDFLFVQITKIWVDNAGLALPVSLSSLVVFKASKALQQISFDDSLRHRPDFLARCVESDYHIILVCRVARYIAVVNTYRCIYILAQPTAKVMLLPKTREVVRYRNTVPWTLLP